jgi:uncharacterized YigZ family protein
MRTLSQPASFEETIRKSRFLAHAAQVESEAETLAFFERVADPKASHNCWAWCIDHRYRFNDDGEPGGTAGKPILSVIEGRELNRVMVIVTRWFGGTKLGVGGLVRAYSGSAAKCLDSASIITLVPRVECLLETGFEWISTAHDLMTAHDAGKLTEEWSDTGLRVWLSIAESRVASLTQALRDASRGQAHLTLIEGSRRL